MIQQKEDRRLRSTTGLLEEMGDIVGWDEAGESSSREAIRGP